MFRRYMKNFLYDASDVVTVVWRQFRNTLRRIGVTPQRAILFFLSLVILGVNFYFVPSVYAFDNDTQFTVEGIERWETPDACFSGSTYGGNECFVWSSRLVEPIDYNDENLKYVETNETQDWFQKYVWNELWEGTGVYNYFANAPSEEWQQMEGLSSKFIYNVEQVLYSWTETSELSFLTDWIFDQGKVENFIKDSDNEFYKYNEIDFIHDYDKENLSFDKWIFSDKAYDRDIEQNGIITSIVTEENSSGNSSYKQELIMERLEKVVRTVDVNGVPVTSGSFSTKSYIYDDGSGKFIYVYNSENNVFYKYTIPEDAEVHWYEEGFTPSTDEPLIYPANSDLEKEVLKHYSYGVSINELNYLFSNNVYLDSTPDNSGNDEFYELLAEEGGYMYDFYLSYLSSVGATFSGNFTGDSGTTVESGYGFAEFCPQMPEGIVCLDEEKTEVKSTYDYAVYQAVSTGGFEYSTTDDFYGLGKTTQIQSNYYSILNGKVKLTTGDFVKTYDGTWTESSFADRFEGLVCDNILKNSTFCVQSEVISYTYSKYLITEENKFDKNGETIWSEEADLESKNETVSANLGDSIDGNVVGVANGEQFFKDENDVLYGSTPDSYEIYSFDVYEKVWKYQDVGTEGDAITGCIVTNLPTEKYNDCDTVAIKGEKNETKTKETVYTQTNSPSVSGWTTTSPTNKCDASNFANNLNQCKDVGGYRVTETQTATSKTVTASMNVTLLQINRDGKNTKEFYGYLLVDNSVANNINVNDRLETIFANYGDKAVRYCPSSAEHYTNCKSAATQTGTFWKYYRVTSKTASNIQNYTQLKNYVGTNGYFYNGNNTSSILQSTFETAGTEYTVASHPSYFLKSNGESANSATGNFTTARFNNGIVDLNLGYGQNTTLYGNNVVKYVSSSYSNTYYKTTTKYFTLSTSTIIDHVGSGVNLDLGNRILTIRKDFTQNVDTYYRHTWIVTDKTNDTPTSNIAINLQWLKENYASDYETYIVCLTNAFCEELLGVISKKTGDNSIFKNNDGYFESVSENLVYKINRTNTSIFYKYNGYDKTLINSSESYLGATTESTYRGETFTEGDYKYYFNKNNLQVSEYQVVKQVVKTYYGDISLSNSNNLVQGHELTANEINRINLTNSQKEELILENSFSYCETNQANGETICTSSYEFYQRSNETYNLFQFEIYKLEELTNFEQGHSNTVEYGDKKFAEVDYDSLLAGYNEDKPLSERLNTCLTNGVSNIDGYKCIKVDENSRKDTFNFRWVKEGTVDRETSTDVKISLIYLGDKNNVDLEFSLTEDFLENLYTIDQNGVLTKVNNGIVQVGSQSYELCTTGYENTLKSCLVLTSDSMENIITLGKYSKYEKEIASVFVENVDIEEYNFADYWVNDELQGYYDESSIGSFETVFTGTHLATVNFLDNIELLKQIRLNNSNDVDFVVDSNGINQIKFKNQTSVSVTLNSFMKQLERETYTLSFYATNTASDKVSIGGVQAVINEGWNFITFTLDDVSSEITLNLDIKSSALFYNFKITKGADRYEKHFAYTSNLAYDESGKFYTLNKGELVKTEVGYFELEEIKTWVALNEDQLADKNGEYTLSQLEGYFFTEEVNSQYEDGVVPEISNDYLDVCYGDLENCRFTRTGNFVKKLYNYKLTLTYVEKANAEVRYIQSTRVEDGEFTPNNSNLLDYFISENPNFANGEVIIYDNLLLLTNKTSFYEFRKVEREESTVSVDFNDAEQMQDFVDSYVEYNSNILNKNKIVKESGNSIFSTYEDGRTNYSVLLNSIDHSKLTFELYSSIHSSGSINGVVYKIQDTLLEIELKDNVYNLIYLKVVYEGRYFFIEIESLADDLITINLQNDGTFNISSTISKRETLSLLSENDIYELTNLWFLEQKYGNDFTLNSSYANGEENNFFDEFSNGLKIEKTYRTYRLTKDDSREFKAYQKMVDNGDWVADYTNNDSGFTGYFGSVYFNDVEVSVDEDTVGVYSVEGEGEPMWAIDESHFAYLYEEKYGEVPNGKILFTKWDSDSLTNNSLGLDEKFEFTGTTKIKYALKKGNTSIMFNNIYDITGFETIDVSQRYSYELENTDSSSTGELVCSDGYMKTENSCVANDFISSVANFKTFLSKTSERNNYFLQMPSVGFRFLGDSSLSQLTQEMESGFISSKFFGSNDDSTVSENIMINKGLVTFTEFKGTQNVTPNIVNVNSSYSSNLHFGNIVSGELENGTYEEVTTFAYDYYYLESYLNNDNNEYYDYSGFLEDVVKFTEFYLNAVVRDKGLKANEIKATDIASYINTPLKVLNVTNGGNKEQYFYDLIEEYENSDDFVKPNTVSSYKDLIYLIQSKDDILKDLFKSSMMPQLSVITRNAKECLANCGWFDGPAYIENTTVVELVTREEGLTGDDLFGSNGYDFNGYLSAGSTYDSFGELIDSDRNKLAEIAFNMFDAAYEKLGETVWESNKIKIYDIVKNSNNILDLLNGVNDLIDNLEKGSNSKYNSSYIAVQGGNSTYIYRKTFAPFHLLLESSDVAIANDRSIYNYSDDEGTSMPIRQNSISDAGVGSNYFDLGFATPSVDAKYNIIKPILYSTVITPESYLEELGEEFLLTDLRYIDESEFEDVAPINEYPNDIYIPTNQIDRTEEVTVTLEDYEIYIPSHPQSNTAIGNWNLLVEEREKILTILKKLENKTWEELLRDSENGGYNSYDDLYSDYLTKTVTMEIIIEEKGSAYSYYEGKEYELELAKQDISRVPTFGLTNETCSGILWWENCSTSEHKFQKLFDGSNFYGKIATEYKIESAIKETAGQEEIIRISTRSRYVDTKELYKSTIYNEEDFLEVPQDTEKYPPLQYILEDTNGEKNSTNLSIFASKEGVYFDLKDHPMNNFDTSYISSIEVSAYNNDAKKYSNDKDIMSNGDYWSMNKDFKAEIIEGKLKITFGTYSFVNGKLQFSPTDKALSVLDENSTYKIRVRVRSNDGEILYDSETTERTGTDMVNNPYGSTLEGTNNNKDWTNKMITSINHDYFFTPFEDCETDACTNIPEKYHLKREEVKDQSIGAYISVTMENGNEKVTLKGSEACFTNSINGNCIVTSEKNTQSNVSINGNEYFYVDFTKFADYQSWATLYPELSIDPVANYLLDYNRFNFEVKKPTQELFNGFTYNIEYKLVIKQGGINEYMDYNQNGQPTDNVEENLYYDELGKPTSTEYINKIEENKFFIKEGDYSEKRLFLQIGTKTYLVFMSDNSYPVIVG